MYRGEMKSSTFLIILVFANFVPLTEANTTKDQVLETRRLGIKQCLDLCLQIVQIGYNPEQLLCQLLESGDLQGWCIRKTSSDKPCVQPCAVGDRCLTSRTKGRVCAPTGVVNTIKASTSTATKHRPSYPVAGNTTCLFDPGVYHLSVLRDRSCSEPQKGYINVVFKPVISNNIIYHAMIRVKIVIHEPASDRHILVISCGMNNTNVSGPEPITNACSLSQKNSNIFLTGIHNDIPLPMLRKGNSEELDIGIIIDTSRSIIDCIVFAVNGKEINVTSNYSTVNITSEPFWARIWFNCDQTGTDFVRLLTCEDTDSQSKRFQESHKYILTKELMMSLGDENWFSEKMGGENHYNK